MTRNVDAQGTTNTFNIQGAGASGPSGSLVGDSGTNAFVFSATGKLLGNIQGGGSSTLNYSAYSSGVTVNLGNGTNGTATGRQRHGLGHHGLDRQQFQRHAECGHRPERGARPAGWAPTRLSGTGAGDSVVESISSSYTLTNTKLTGTGAGFTDNLSGITVATLTGVSATSNAFTVSGWTGTGSLSAPAGTGDRDGEQERRLHPDQHLAVVHRRHVAELERHHDRQPHRHRRSGNTFTVTGWTGGGSLKGTAETVVDSVSSSVTLTNTSLAVTGLPTLTLSGFTTANLTDTAGGNTFTVSGWTGSGSLTDSGHGGHRDGEQERQLHPDQHLAVVDRRHVADLERDHDRQPHRHRRRQDVHGQRLDGERVADRHGDGHRDGERERRLHPDQHVAVVHRRHDAGLERDHDRQPHRHQQGGNTFTVTGWTGKRIADRHGGHPGGHGGGERHVDQHLAGGDRAADPDA